MAELVRSKIFGKDQNSTIYYFVGYRGKIDTFKFHIKLLVLAGYRIVAFEYDPKVLNSGYPKHLIQAIESAMTKIKHDKVEHNVIGTYGISLGSLFVLNVITLPEIKKAILNTGGVRLSKAVWESPLLAKEKAKYQNNGYSKERLDRIWNAYDISSDGKKLKGKKLLVMDSKQDPIILYDDVKEHLTAWKEQGVDLELVLSVGLNHGQEIFKNLLRIRRTIKFYE